MNTLPFHWCGGGTKKENRTHYQQFVLNNTVFNIGDCVYLFPEDDAQAPYLGRIRSAFIDESTPGADPPPHNIEVKWFERRVNLETSTKGIVESEKEVFELEDTDVNPIGCISGKCQIIRARNFDDAQSVLQEQQQQQQQHDWYFCRGFYLQATNSFRPYTTAELAADGLDASAAPATSAMSAPMPATAAAPAAGSLPSIPQLSVPSVAAPAVSGATATTAKAEPSPVPAFSTAASMQPAGSATLPPVAMQAAAVPPTITVPTPPSASPAPPAPASAPEQVQWQPTQLPPVPAPALAPAPKPASPPARAADDRPSTSAPAAKRLATGRVCVECGATSTPQWREGPQGPKTLCNACGVRHVRSLQRANKAKASGAKAAGAAQASPGGGRGRGRAGAAAAEAKAEPAKAAAETSGRPVRQAAIAALSRTAAFARTGEFPDDDDPEEAVPPVAAGGRRGAGATANGGGAHM